MQNVIEQIIIDNYIITKKAFGVVNDYINNIAKAPTIKTTIIDENGKKQLVYVKMEKIEMDNEGEQVADLLNYISFLSYNDNAIMIDENEEEKEHKNIIKALNLTPKQTEILDIYSKTYNYTKTAELLGITRKAVSITMERIREKINKLNIKIA